MRKLILFSLTLLLVSGVARAQVPADSTHALVYDARTGCGPYLVTNSWYEYLKQHPESFTCLPSQPPLVFRDTRGIQILILNARFLVTYTATLSSQIDHGPGTLEVRGLSDVAAAGLDSGAAANVVPVTHGGRLASTVQVPPITPAQVLEALIDPSLMHTLQAAIDAQNEDLVAAETTLMQAKAQFMVQFRQIEGTRPATLQCSGPIGLPTIAVLTACVDQLKDRFLEDTRCSQQGSAGCGTPPQACQGIAAAPWSREVFLCALDQVDVRILDLQRLRASLADFGLAAAADRITTETTQLVTKLEGFKQNLAVVRSTVEDFLEWRKATQGALSLQLGQRAEIRKQLKERYGTSLDDAELNKLLDAATAARGADLFTARFKKAIEEDLQARIKELTDGRAGDNPLPTLVSRVSTARDTREIRDSVDQLTAHIANLNQAFANVFQIVNATYITQADPFRSAQLDLSTGAGSNRTVLAVIHAADAFTPYRFEAPQPPPAPQPGAAAAAGPNSPTIGPAPAPGFSVTPGSKPAPDRGFEVRLHKMWRANVISGVAFSSVADQSFVVRSRPKVVDGVTQMDDHGQPLSENFVTSSGSQRPNPLYMIGMTFYPWWQDTFPGVRTDWRNRFSIMGGVGISDKANYFVGVNYEPAIGVDVAIGLHYGHQTVLQTGVSDGSVVTESGSGAAPTRQAFKPGLFVLIGFDLKIFKTIFGGS